MLSVYT